MVTYRAGASISLPSPVLLAGDGAMKWDAPDAYHHGLGMVPPLWHGEEVSKCRGLLQKCLNVVVQTGLGVRISPE